MPIDVDVHDDERLRIILHDPDFAHQINLLLSSLLTSQLDRAKNWWTVTWPDFLIFREKMDSLGITQGRTVTQEGFAWIKQQQALDAEMDSIKGGEQNQFLPDLTKLLKTTPYSDQQSGVRFLSTRREAVLADEMGIGKTLQLLATFAVLKAKGEAKHMLVLCPNSVKTGWMKEVSKHTKLTVSMIGNGSVQMALDIKAYSKKRTDVLVCHYDGLTNHKSKLNKKRTAWGHTVEELLKLPWDIFVLDEAHQVKTLEAKRTVATMHLTDNGKDRKKRRTRLYLATGTPVSESPIDAWSVLSFLNKNALPKTFSRFENYFTVKVRKEAGGRVWGETTGYKNLGELKRLLHRMMIRRLKTDIAGMPEKVFITREVQMTGAQKVLYDDIKRGIYDSVVQDPSEKLNIAFAMTKLIRLRQTLNHPSLVDQEGESCKYEELDGILEEVLSNPTAKAVVWVEFRDAVKLLSERYQKKYGCIQLIGGTSQEQMAHWSKNWDTMPERLAIAIPLFGGTGVDFLSRCRTAIYVECPYSLITFRQSIDRIHRRTGDGEPKDEIDKIKRSTATIIFLQVKNSVDELVMRLLTRKGDMADALLTTDDKLAELGRAELLEYLR